MGDGPISAAVPNVHDLAALYRQQRSDSISSADSGMGLMEGGAPTHTKNQHTDLHPPLSDIPEIENTLGENLKIIEDGEVCSAGATKPLPDQYEQIHAALLRSFKVVEDTTEKLCTSFNADKLSNAFKKEDMSEEAGTDFCFLKEIPKFKALFCEVKEAIHGLKTDSYSKEALKKLEIAQASLSDQYALLKSNLPPPQSKAFKIFNYVLEGLGTLITIIAIALTGLGVAVSTTAPCAAAAAIYLMVRAWREKIALPEANKNMYLTSLEKLYAESFSALKVMGDDVFIIEQREARARQQQENAALQKQQQEAREALLEAQEAASQKILSAIAKPALSNATVKDLIAEIRSRNKEELRASCATEEEFEVLMKLAQERTPSPDVIRAQATPQALTGQA